jgi:hypothetical protein
MEGTIPEFLFKEDDVVLIGEGSCALAALSDAVEADSTLIILKTREMWLSNEENGPPPSAIFDAGNVPQNRAVLECLQRHAKGADVYLAGEIPLGTAFRAPPIEDFALAFDGEHPRRIERRALERSMALYDLLPCPLHLIHCGNAGALPPLDAERAAQMRTGLQGVHTRCREALAQGFRPRFDKIRESTETALVTERHDDTVFAIAWLRGPFDTAYFDARLADRYRAEGACTIVLDRRAILLGGAALTAHCAAAGLDLYTVEADI